jgi:ribosomal protein S18 acetylase RimI-like enzyme
LCTVQSNSPRENDRWVPKAAVGSAVGAQTANTTPNAPTGSLVQELLVKDGWEHAMAAGAAYVDARCLIGRNAQGEAVAGVTVWSAGPGKPGLIEPMGVHRAHRGHGYGQAITVAAARALRELGSSSAVVCTPAFNVGAVATYQSAGFEPLPETRDVYRDA